MIIVETERLRLRHPRPTDDEAMNRVFGDAEVMRFGLGVRDPRWVREWLRRCQEDYRERSGIGPWAVEEKRSEETIGYSGLFHYPDIGDQPETEIGYRLARPHWGRGYATEAASSVRDHAFDTLNMSRLIAMIDPQNVASIRVARKIGMRFEKAIMLEGYTHPDHVYAVERDAFAHDASV